VHAERAAEAYLAPNCPTTSIVSLTSAARWTIDSEPQYSSFFFAIGRTFSSDHTRNIGYTMDAGLRGPQGCTSILCLGTRRDPHHHPHRPNHSVYSSTLPRYLH